MDVGRSNQTPQQQQPGTSCANSSKTESLDVESQSSTLPPLPPPTATSQPLTAREWTHRKKLITTWVVSIFKFISGLTSTSIVPNLPSIADEFHTRGVLSIFPLSTYFLGYAAGLLLIGPLSETFGRVGALQLSNISFIVFNTAAGFAQTNTQVIVLRVLSGFGGAGPLSLGGGILNDCFTPEERTSMITVYALPGQLSPALGPILGAICDQYLHWRWTFWIVSIISVALQVVCFLTVNETYQPVLQRRWEKKQQQQQNSEKDGSKWWPLWTAEEAAHMKKSLRVNTARPFKMLATHPIVQLIALSNGLTYGIQMLVTASLDQLWRDRYQQSTILASLNYLALGVGLVVGAQICRRGNQKVYRTLKEKHDGQGKPEFRIPMIAIGTIIVPLGLLWYGWSAQALAFPLVPDLGVFVLALGLVTILNCTSLYLVDTYKLQSASATGAVNLLRSLAGFAFPLFSTSLYERIGYGWANTMLAGITILIGWPVPLLLWRYGEHMRRPLNEGY